MNVVFYQIGIAFKRFKIKEQIATENSIKRSLEFDSNYIIFNNIDQFISSLCLTPEDNGYIYDLYYYDVKVKQLSKHTYLVSYKNINHYSIVYVAKSYHNKVDKWISGWKGNTFGIMHKYKKEDNEILNFIKINIDIDNQIKELKNNLYPNATFINKRNKLLKFD